MKLILEAIKGIELLKIEISQAKVELNDLVAEFIFSSKIIVSDVNSYGTNQETGIDYMVISASNDFSKIRSVFEGVVSFRGVGAHIHRDRVFFTVPVDCDNYELFDSHVQIRNYQKYLST